MNSPLEKLTCSLQQAEELRSLGVNLTRSLFHWRVYVDKKSINATANVTYGGIHCYDGRAWKCSDIFPAFTASELCEMLGNGFASWSFPHPKDGSLMWIATRLAPNQTIRRDRDLSSYNECDRYAKTQAEALAELLISCIKCGVPIALKR